MKLIAYMGKDFAETRVSDAGFSVRTENALRRNGLETMEQVCEACASGKIRTLKGLGKKSVIEVWSKIFELQLERLTPEEVKEYILDIAAVNA